MLSIRIIFLFFLTLNSKTLAKSVQSDLSSDVNIKWVDDKFVLELLKQPSRNNSTLVIIDTRSSNEYNGWKSFEKYDYNTDLLNVFYGHFKGAVNFEVEWLFNYNETQLNDLFTNRVGLLQIPDEEIIGNQTTEENSYEILIYDTKLERLEAMRDYFLNKYRIQTLYLYKIIDKKVLYEELEKQNLTHLTEYEPAYDILVSPEFLYSLIFNPIASIATTYRIANLTQTTPSLVQPIPNYKLFDVSNVDENQFYMISHIPTSVHLSTNEVEEPPLWNRKSRAKLIELLAELGIRENNTELIIFYGNPDPMAAFRAAVIFKWLGVNNVKVLNGGYKSWLRRNFPIEKKFNKRIPVEKSEAYFNNKIDTEKSTYIVNMEFMQDLVKNFNTFWDQYSVIDIRTWKEFSGEVSGYEDLNITGRIPGSIWGKAGYTIYDLEDYRNPDSTMRSSDDIRAMWTQLGIDYKNKHLIFYCGNGWRAGEVLIYAEIMGLTRISLYDGGWYEWTSLANNTIEKGLPQFSTFNWDSYGSTKIIANNSKLGNDTFTDNHDIAKSDAKSSANKLFSFNIFALFNLVSGCLYFNF